MNHERITEHTTLIDREEDLLHQIDTCQQMKAALWRFLYSSDEKIHVPTVRRLFDSLYDTERINEDELLDVRLALLPFAIPRKLPHPKGTKH